jgi:hypothetical protein
MSDISRRAWLKGLALFCPRPAHRPCWLPLLPTQKPAKHRCITAITLRGCKYATCASSTSADALAGWAGCAWAAVP